MRYRVKGLKKLHLMKLSRNCNSRTKPLRTLRQLTENILLKDYAPAAILIDKQGKILYVHGKTGVFLDQIEGYVKTINIFKLIKFDLRIELTKSLFQAVETGQSVTSPLIRLNVNDEELLIDMSIKVVKKHIFNYDDTPLYLIILQQSKKIENEYNKLRKLVHEYKTAKVELEKLKSEMILIEKACRVKVTNKISNKVESNSINKNIEFKASLNENENSNDILLKEDVVGISEFTDTVDKSEKNNLVYNEEPVCARDSKSFTESKAITLVQFENDLEFNKVMSHGYRHDNEIRKIVIPEGVERIKSSMFFDCKNLEEVIIPSTLKYIEDFAFYGCQNLKLISLNNAKLLVSIGKSAFEKCKSMTTLNFPGSIVEIKPAAFLECSKISNIDFSENSCLEILGSHAFKNCEKVETLKLPSSLKCIGISAFYECKNLLEITLTLHLEKIGEYAFFGCESLKEIVIPCDRLLEQPAFNVGFPDSIKLVISNGSVV